MDTAPQAPASITTKATPLDVFLWLTAIISLYGSVIAIVTLLFEYINWVYPDPLAYYGDMYGSSIRFAMASLIVLAPIGIFALRTIRLSIMREPAKAQIWVRRWALITTIFLAGAIAAIDLITLINTFLGGEITTRFLLKVFVVLLISAFVGLHYIADLRGYWIAHPRRAVLVGAKAGTLAFIVVAAGFFIIGTPAEMRLMRFDEQKIYHLQDIQYQVLNYWQQKQELPETLADLNDPLAGYVAPVDPQTGEPYRYEMTGDLSFTLCATFNLPTPHLEGRGGYPARDLSYPSMHMDENWDHATGETCFMRTIDPERYPPYSKPL